MTERELELYNLVDRGMKIFLMACPETRGPITGKDRNPIVAWTADAQAALTRATDVSVGHDLQTASEPDEQAGFRAGMEAAAKLCDEEAARSFNSILQSVARNCAAAIRAAAR